MASSRPPRLQTGDRPEQDAAAHRLPNDSTRGTTVARKLDDPIVRGILLGAAAFATVENAAALAGVTPSSVYDLRHRDPEFERMWQTARARTIISIELALTRSALKGDVQAQKYALNNMSPDKWRERREVAIVAGGMSSSILAAADRARARRDARIAGAVTAEVVDGNGHKDAAALEGAKAIVPVKPRGGNGNGRG